MTIAELFLNIGITGAQGVGRALGGIKGALGEVATSSLEAKAAVIGAVYGFEKITGFASQAGMELFKFNTITGLSTEELQRWQYAAMHFDVTGEEVAGTLKGIQSSMTNLKLTGNGPSGLGLLASSVGFDTRKMDDTYYVLGQIQKFVKTAPVSLGNEVAKSFGLSENFIQMLRLANIEKDKIRKTDIITPQQINQLVDVNKKWKDFWFNLKTTGVKLVADNPEAVNFAFKEMGDGLEALGDAFGEFKSFAKDNKEIATGIGLIAVALAAFMSPAIAAAAIITELVAGFGELKKLSNGEEMFGGLVSKESVAKFKNVVGKPGEWLAGMLEDSNQDIMAKAQLEQLGKNKNRDLRRLPGSTQLLQGPMTRTGHMQSDEGAARAGAQWSPSQAGFAPKVEVHNYGVTHPKETGEATSAGIKRAYRQLASQVGG